MIGIDVMTDVERLLNRAVGEGRTVLTLEEAKAVAAFLGIRCPAGRVVARKDEAVAAARAVGYPVVVKACSPMILHKSDLGAVVTNLACDEAVAQAYEQVIEAAGTVDPNGAAMVEHMEPPGTEVIVGLTTDPQFGPVVMVGLGGVLTQVYEDVAFRLAPVDEREAADMLESLRARRVLHGYRGRPPIDIARLTRAIAAVSRLPQQFACISQVDLNPLIAHADDLVAVDVKVVLADAGGIKLGIV